MKAIIIIVLVLFTSNYSNAQDTLYIYKSGTITQKCAINDIDSIVFYKAIKTYYDITKCLDPWQKADNDSVLIFNVKTYLISNNIQVINIIISPDGVFELCKSCGCKTGRRINAIINSNDLDKIQQLRFYECK